MGIVGWLERNCTKCILAVLGSFVTALFFAAIYYFAWVGVTAGSALARDTYDKDRRVLDHRLDRIIDKIDRGFSNISNRFAGIDEQLAGMKERFDSVNKSLDDMKNRLDSDCEARTTGSKSTR